LALKLAAEVDASLTNAIQHESPAEDNEAHRLPAPRATRYLRAPLALDAMLTGD
jgi:hypothetical protein